MFGQSTTAPIKPRPRGTDTDQRFSLLKKELHARLIQGIDLAALRTIDAETLRRELRGGAEELCRNQLELITLPERKRLVEELIDETLGFGPLEPLLRDESVSDILVNGPRTIYVERNGRLESAEVCFNSDDHLLEIVQRIVTRVGRRIDESSPMVDARLADGSRVNAVIRPLALDGALVSIRRFAHRPLSAEQLVDQQTATPDMLAFLAACVQARMNILVSGGTGSGKTTLLNILSGYIPLNERVVTIEDAAELRLRQPHVARMETRPANLEGVGAVSTRDLLRNALRMRPDRIVIGECRGGEAFDMLQAMNTGHDGSMTTIHANNVQDAILRLELLIGMSGLDLSASVLHRQIAAGIQLVVHVARLCGGVRKVVGIAEVVGVEGHGVKLQELFSFQQTGVDSGGAAVGQFLRPGQSAACLNRLRAAGFSESFGFASKSDA